MSKIHKSDQDHSDTVEITENELISKDNCDINKDAPNFFLSTRSFDQHLLAQKTNVTRYIAAIIVLEKSGVEISSNARVQALAVAWSRCDHQFADALLQHREKFGVAEILKAVTLLDTARRIRVLERQLKKLEITKARGKVHKKKFSTIKSNMNNLLAVKPSRGSASGAVCKHIRQWVRQFTKKELEFSLLQFDPELWRKLADLVHFNPSTDFPELPWFLKYCYDSSEAPVDSIVALANTINSENVNAILNNISLPYSSLRKVKKDLDSASKATVVRGEDKVDRALWWYEELCCPEVDKVIEERLASGETVTFNYGKLMELLLKFRLMHNCPPFYDRLLPIAESKLQSYSLSLEAPIVVLGDASGSMEVAIRTATIISSLLTALTNAQLIFFNTKSWPAPTNPRTVSEALQLACDTKAYGGTSPAAALYPFYERKEVVKTFIIVTDEEENTQFEGYLFAQLFQKYKNEVYDASLIFVSFLEDQHAKGEMMNKLSELGTTPIPQQYRLHRTCPDLSKLDNILGLLAIQGNHELFEKQLFIVEKEIKEQGLKAVLQDLFGNKMNNIASTLNNIDLTA